ncbi:DNA excision repair protein ERCC-6-like 2 [Nymphon striatum]|nr:DNA excision repair protein ERCC-6-like 2 [Nymphon striatum]
MAAINEFQNEQKVRKKYGHLQIKQHKISIIQYLDGKKDSHSKKMNNNLKLKVQRKSCVATGGDEIKYPDAKSGTKSKNENFTLIKSPEKNELLPVIRPDASSFNSEKLFDGFDFQKPSFNHSPCSPKEPYWLSDSRDHQIPAVINQYLRDYQRDGVKFLYNNYIKEQGALLGDDMGLGKTIQVIALLAALLHKTGTKNDVIRFKPNIIQKLTDPNYGRREIEPNLFLIVVPASVLYNWCHEFDVWGHFAIGKFHKNEKMETLTRAKRGKIEIVITTFQTVKIHIVELNALDWSGIFVDEVHKIKESKAGITKTLKSIKIKRRFGLTGTVMQNSMKELWCLLDWANPACLGSEKEFKNSFINVIEEGLQHDASKRQLAEARKVQKKFNSMLQVWMIRRTKSLLKDQLPKKMDLVVFCEPGEFQKLVYKRITQSSDVEMILNQSNLCLCGSMKPQGKCCVKANSKGKSIKSMTFAYMQLLLKTANHLALSLPKKAKSDQILTKDDILEFIDSPDVKSALVSDPIYTFFNPKYCGKIKVLTDLISVFKEHKNKILIFSFTTRLLDILENYVLNHGLEYRRIDGKTRNDLRFKYVEEFNNDPNIFLCLLSTRAGGVGLNITGANIVVIFDPNWNPSHDLQAQDRAYRIGQRKDVKVYRLISAGTIEENMYLRQIYKQVQLEKSIIGSENAKRYFSGSSTLRNSKGEIFGIKNIFQFRESNICLTDEILKRHKCVEKKLSGHMIAEYILPTKSSMPHVKEISISESSEDADAISDEEKLVIPSKRKIKQLSKRNVLNKVSGISSDDEHNNSNQELLVDQVLKSSGILHTHANQDVVGASKAEDHMTKCALHDVFVDNINSQELAVHCLPFKKIKRRNLKKSKFSRKMEADLSKANIIVGKTPPAVQMDHFREMAAKTGRSINELAEQVRKMSNEDLKNFLSFFYSNRYDLNLQLVFDNISDNTTDVGDSNLSSDNSDENFQTASASFKTNKQDELAYKLNGSTSSIDHELNPGLDSDSSVSSEEFALNELYIDLFDNHHNVEVKPPPKKSSKHNINKDNENATVSNSQSHNNDHYTTCGVGDSNLFRNNCDKNFQSASASSKTNKQDELAYKLNGSTSSIDHELNPGLDSDSSVSSEEFALNELYIDLFDNHHNVEVKPPPKQSSKHNINKDNENATVSNSQSHNNDHYTTCGVGDSNLFSNNSDENFESASASSKTNKQDELAYKLNGSTFSTDRELNPGLDSSVNNEEFALNKLYIDLFDDHHNVEVKPPPKKSSKNNINKDNKNTTESNSQSHNNDHYSTCDDSAEMNKELYGMLAEVFDI